MKSTRILSTLILLSMVTASVIACQPTATAVPKAEEKPVSTEPIYFAWYGPLTGDAKQYGDTEKVAVELALKEVNEGWGGVLGGRKIIVDFFDDKNDAKETVVIANRIVGEGKYTAAIGGFSSTCSMAAAPIFEEAKIVNYSPTASHADYSKMGEYIFRNTPTQALETKNYAEYAYNNLNVRTVFILNANDDWGNNISRIFKENFEQLGGKVVGQDVFILGQTTDFTPMISKAKEAKPDALFIVAYYGDSANVLIQADGLDFKTQMIVASASLKPEFIEIAGELANGTFLMNAFTPDIETDRFKKVMADYKALTGKSGDAFVMQTYDVVRQLATALNLAGTDNRVALRDALAGMKDYECLAGTYSMNDVGDAVRVLQPIMVINKQFTNMAKK